MGHRLTLHNLVACGNPDKAELVFTPASHAGNRGSIPLGATIYLMIRFSPQFLFYSLVKS